MHIKINIYFKVIVDSLVCFQKNWFNPVSVLPGIYLCIQMSPFIGISVQFLIFIAIQTRIMEARRFKNRWIFGKFPNSLWPPPPPPLFREKCCDFFYEIFWNGNDPPKLAFLMIKNFATKFFRSEKCPFSSAKKWHFRRRNKKTETTFQCQHPPKMV